MLAHNFTNHLPPHLGWPRSPLVSTWYRLLQARASTHQQRWKSQSISSWYNVCWPKLALPLLTLSKCPNQTLERNINFCYIGPRILASCDWCSNDSAWVFSSSSTLYFSYYSTKLRYMWWKGWENSLERTRGILFGRELVIKVSGEMLKRQSVVGDVRSDCESRGMGKTSMNELTLKEEKDKNKRKTWWSSTTWCGGIYLSIFSTKLPLYKFEHHLRRFSSSRWLRYRFSCDIFWNAQKKEGFSFLYIEPFQQFQAWKM